MARRRRSRDLSMAFERAVERIEGAEREALDALDGQRRLVREVHHRVKNNLQVVASLLSIHGRSAAKPEAKAAYSAIGRRVDALSVVHRHHYAELEENRGIALRPLLTELAADLRSSAPVEARGMRIDLELDAPSTTQDVAVAAAFLITEIVEFAMLRHPDDAVEISLRREDELTATLAISSVGAGPGRRSGRCRQEPVRADRRRPGPPASLPARPQARPLCGDTAGISERLIGDRSGKMRRTVE